MQKAIIAALFLQIVLPAMSLSQPFLECAPAYLRDYTVNTGIEPASAAERVRMQQAPHWAVRKSKHILIIRWNKGSRTFADKPPFDEPLDGIAWTYCGYNSAVGYHLIGKQDIDLFTGILLDEKSGALLPGGHAVVFSPSLQQYIAYEQPDGQDSETIKLYDRSGRLLWRGYSSLLSRDGKTVLADFDKIYWTSAGELTAEFEDSKKQKNTIRLAQNSRGKWEWQTMVGIPIER